MLYAAIYMLAIGTSVIKSKKCGLHLFQELEKKFSEYIADLFKSLFICIYSIYLRFPILLIKSYIFPKN